MLQSTLIIPVAGTIYMKQVVGEDVQMWGKLFWTDDTNTTVEHNWHIHTLAVRLAGQVLFMLRDFFLIPAWRGI